MITGTNIAFCIALFTAFRAGLRTQPICNRVRVQEIFASPSSSSSLKVINFQKSSAASSVDTDRAVESTVMEL